MRPQFRPGNNIAMKVPAHEFDRTVAFYRDVLRFKQKPASAPDQFDSVVFEFGDKNLWIDKIAGLSQAEVWLEVATDDTEQAGKYLAEMGCVRRDEIEPLAENFSGFWICNPANIIHLVAG
ncbi:MAG: hypothetical protein OEN20_07125 [Gammaproteobacteria bacterium]|nr:hypothetical protein [Gammaproteobacteria bacterium]